MGPQWSGDGAQKKRARRRKMEKKGGAPKMAPEKVRRRLHHLPPISILVSFYLIKLFIFCE